MPFTDSEILETVRMFELETFDIRTTTLGISLLDCADPDLESAAEKVYTKIVHHGRNLVEVAGGIEADLGVPIINKRVSTTPIALVAAASASEDLVPFARAMDAAAAMARKLVHKDDRPSSSQYLDEQTKLDGGRPRTASQDGVIHQWAIPSEGFCFYQLASDF